MSSQTHDIMVEKNTRKNSTDNSSVEKNHSKFFENKPTEWLTFVLINEDSYDEEVTVTDKIEWGFGL